MISRVFHQFKGELTMESILQELWYGNVSPCEGRTVTSIERKVAGHVSDHYNDLMASLSEKEKEVFKKFEDSYSELRDIGERESFIYAFQLGARIAIEVMSLDVSAD